MLEVLGYIASLIAIWEFICKGRIRNGAKFICKMILKKLRWGKPEQKKILPWEKFPLFPLMREVLGAGLSRVGVIDEKLAIYHMSFPFVYVRDAAAQLIR